MAQLNIIPRIKFAGTIVSIAPLLMWVFLYYMLNYFQIILIDLDSYTLKLEVNFYQLLILDNLWVTYISLQLL